MDESPSANDAPTTPSWAQAALTAGVGVVAGLVLGRKGMTRLAAGVAAVAGAKMLAHARCGENEGDESEVPTHDSAMHAPMEVLSPEELSLETAPPSEETPDWIDHDAVQFSHVVPDDALAVEMLKEKELPLLDDDGLPVEHVAVHPLYPEVPDKKVEDGPLIWEPGRFIQSHSNGTSATVWFGLHDVLPPVGKPAPEPAQQLVEQIASVEAPALETPPSASQLLFPPAPPATAGPIITPKHTALTVLPQPRHTTSHPDHAHETAHLPPGLRLTSAGIPAVHHTQRVSQRRSSSSHRHLAPHAPSGIAAPERRWPLTVLLSVLVAIAIFLAIDRWTNGSLFQKLGQKRAIEQTVSPTAAPPVAASPAARSEGEPGLIPPTSTENPSNR